MNPHQDVREGAEHNGAVRRVGARHAEFDRQIEELRTLVHDLSRRVSMPPTTERVLELLRQAVDDLASDSLDLHRQIGELRRRLQPGEVTRSRGRRVGLVVRAATARGLALARGVRRRLRRAARGATGEEAIRRLNDRHFVFPVPALAVVLPEGGVGRASDSSRRPSESVLGAQTLARSGLVEWVRLEAGRALIEDSSSGEVREAEPSAISAALRSPFVITADSSCDFLPVMALELAILELLLEDLLFVRLDGRYASRRPGIEVGGTASRRGVVGPWVVRREVWCPERGIDWESLARTAEHDRRWVLGKVLPVGNSYPAPYLCGRRDPPPSANSGEGSEAGIALEVCWRRDGYLVRRGSALRPLSVVDSSAILDPTLMKCEKPSTMLCLPFIGDTEVDELLGQLVVKLEDRCRFAVAALESQPEATGRMLEALRGVTPWVLPLGELSPQMRGARLSYFIHRLGAESLVWAHGERGRHGGEPDDEMRELLASLTARHPSLRIVALATHPETARELETWSQFHEVALLGEDVPVGIDPALFGQGRFSAEERQRWRRELGVGDEAVLVLMAAALHPEQRPEDFLALAKRLEPEPRFVFALVGDGPLGASIDDLARFLGLRKLRRLPSVSDRAELLAAADVVVSPAELDPAPLAILGALAMARPVVINGASSLADLVRETGCGRVVDRVGDLPELTRAIESLASAGERTCLAQRGPRALADRFTLEASAEAFARLVGLRSGAVTGVS